MTGKSHIATGIAYAVLAADALAFMNMSHIENINTVPDTVTDFLLDNGTIPMFFYVGCAVILYILGTILPDIDSPGSLVGRHVYIPVEHRTWTHSLWPLIVLLLVGIKFRLVFMLGLGYFTHLFADSYSYAGVDWFYPHKSKHHVIKLYKAGKPSEYILDCITYLILIIITGFTIYFALN